MQDEVAAERSARPGTGSDVPAPVPRSRFAALRFPHPFALLVSCILLAAALSHVVPAGQFDRRDDAATGRRVVVAGTYHQVAPAPVGAFQALVALPRGMVDAASVVFYVFLVGGAFSVVEQTGALRRMVDWLAGSLANRGVLVIPASCAAFGLGGILIQMQEELIAFVPVLLLLTRRLGFDAATAVAMSLGASAVGAAFSPINPFQVGIAQKVAELPLLSGGMFRIAFLIPALGLWTIATMRYAERTRVAPAGEGPSATTDTGSRRQDLVLVVVTGTFAMFVFGVLKLGWDFDQLSALFFLMGVLAGIIGGLGLEGTAAGFSEGFRQMALAALLIGAARGIYVALDQGLIVDTIVQALFAPLAHLPILVSALGMMVLQAGVHVAVPRTSGQAVLTLPLLIPLSDLLGLARQVVVLAYQYGAGICELLTPTNGALMAMLAAAGVPYGRWFRFSLWPLALLAILGACGVALGIATGLS